MHMSDILINLIFLCHYESAVIDITWPESNCVLKLLHSC